MTRATSIVRLLCAGTLGFASCKFVSLYAATSDVRYAFDHPGEHTLMNLNTFLLTSGWYTYAVPAALLALGAFVVWRWPKAQASLEVVISVLWVLAFIWFATAITSWQLQNIPIISGNQLHY
jgi:hypothetical protein